MQTMPLQNGAIAPPIWSRTPCRARNAYNTRRTNARRARKRCETTYQRATATATESHRQPARNAR
eukprot:941894-Lingulodinium_polyedra.AAC.1